MHIQGATKMHAVVVVNQMLSTFVQLLH